MMFMSKYSKRLLNLRQLPKYSTTLPVTVAALRHLSLSYFRQQLLHSAIFEFRQLPTRSTMPTLLSSAVVFRYLQQLQQQLPPWLRPRPPPTATAADAGQIPRYAGVSGNELARATSGGGSRTYIQYLLRPGALGQYNHYPNRTVGPYTHPWNFYFGPTVGR